MLAVPLPWQSLFSLRSLFHGWRFIEEDFIRRTRANLCKGSFFKDCERNVEFIRWKDNLWSMKNKVWRWKYWKFQINLIQTDPLYCPYFKTQLRILLYFVVDKEEFYRLMENWILIRLVEVAINLAHKVCLFYCLISISYWVAVFKKVLWFSHWETQTRCITSKSYYGWILPLNKPTWCDFYGILEDHTLSESFCTTDSILSSNNLYWTEFSYKIT